MNPVVTKFLVSAAKFVVKGFAAQGTGMIVEKAFRGDLNPTKLVEKIKRKKPESIEGAVNTSATICAVRARSSVSQDRYKTSKLADESLIRTDDGTLSLDESRDFMVDLDLESRFPYESANDAGELKSLFNRFENDDSVRYTFEAMDGRDISSTQQLEVRAYQNGNLYEIVQLDSTNLDGVVGDEW